MQVINAYSVQVLSHFDAFTGRVLRRWYTKEYRRVYATSARAAVHKVYCGPFDSVGSVHNCGTGEREE